MNAPVLLGLEGQGIQGWAKLQSAVRLAQEIGTIEHISNILRSAATLNGPEMLRTVVKVNTTVGPAEILTRIKTSRSLKDEFSTFDLILLRFADVFSMTPEMTLPHPELIADPQWLILAAELDPEWTHPLVQKPMKNIASTLRFSSAYDFYAQGQTLLAFSDPNT